MSKKRFWLGYVIGLGLAALLSGFVLYQRVFRPPAISLQTLELVDLAGQPFPVAQLAGQPVVLNCWATWCVGCVAEFPDFEQVLHQTPPGVRFLMVSDEPAAKVAVFRKKHPYPFTFLRLQHPIEGLNVLPATYIFDKQGRLLTSRTGQLHRSELLELLAEATD